MNDFRWRQQSGLDTSRMRALWRIDASHVVRGLVKMIELEVCCSQHHIELRASTPRETKTRQRLTERRLPCAFKRSHVEAL